MDYLKMVEAVKEARNLKPWQFVMVWLLLLAAVLTPTGWILFIVWWLKS